MADPAPQLPPQQTTPAPAEQQTPAPRTKPTTSGKGATYATGSAALQMKPADDPSKPKVADPYEELKAIVKTTRADQIAAIKGYLGGATITDGDIEKVLRIFETLDGATIVAMMQALSAGQIKDYVDNLNSPHVGRFRREVLDSLFGAWPGQLVDLDTDVVTDMNLDGLNGRESLELAYVLRNLPKGKLNDILDSNNGPKVRGIMTTPSTYGKEDFDKANATALIKEKKRAGTADEDKKQLANVDVGAKVKGMLDILDDLIVTDAEATRILDWIGGYYPSDATIGAITRHLAKKGALERLIDELPSEARWGKGLRMKTFCTVLKFRAPEKNLATAESLLSYGVFDWAITDEEARLAYHLIKAQPPNIQDRFRKAESGKWFIRMEHELNASVVKSGEYQGVEVEKDQKTGEWVDVAEMYSKKLAEKPTADFYKDVVAMCEKGFDGENARKIYTKLSGNKDKTGLRAVVRRLDALGFVEPLLSTLGKNFLFAEENRAPTLRILCGRDPVHQAAHARSLLSLGLFDWAVTSEEALLAFYMVKALPEGERKVFMEADGGKWWKKIDAEMTQEMRESTATTFYDGGENQGDQNSIRAQLLDDANWDPKNTARLDGLVRMAKMAGDGVWVFAESKRREAYKTLPATVEKHALYNPDKGRLKYAPETLNQTQAEGPLATFDSIGQSLDFLYTSKDVETAHYLGGKGLNLPELQDVLGGSIMGMRLKRHEELGQEGKDAKDKKEGVNFGDAKWDLVNGVLDFQAQDLRIAAVNRMVGTTRLSTKDGVISKINVSARYPTKANPKPPYLEVNVGKVELNDVMIVNTGSMQTANQLRLADLFVKFARPGTTKDELIAAHDSNRIPVPIVGGMLSSVWNIIDVIGVEDDAKAMTDGFTDPKSPMGLEVSLGDFTLDGVATSGGFSAKSVTMKNLFLGGGATRSAYLTGKIASVDRAIDRAKKAGQTEKAAQLEKEKATLAAELKDVEPKEKELFALQDKYRADPKAFPAADQARLDALQKSMKSGGFVADIGEVAITGMDGSVKADDMSVKNVHAEAQGQALGFSLLTQGKLVDDFKKNGTPKAPTQADTAKSAGGASASLSFDDLDVKNLDVKGSIPTLKDLDARITELKRKLAKDEASEPERQEQVKNLELRPKIARYEELQAMGLTTLSAPQKAEFQALRTELNQAVAFHADHIGLKNVTAKAGIGADGKTGVASLNVGALDASGIQAGGVSVASVTGTNVGVDANLAGLDTVLDPKKMLTSAGVHADSLTATGIKDTKRGIEIKKIGVEGLGVTGSDLGTDAKIGVKAKKIEVEGINLSGKIAALEAELERLVSVPEAKRTAEQTKRLEEVNRALKEYSVLRGKVVSAEESLDLARGTPKEAEAQRKVELAKKALEAWSQVAARIEVKDVDLMVSGLGDVTSGFNVDQALAGKGITIEGKGGPDGKTAVGSAMAEGVKLPNGTVGKVALENLGGKVTATNEKIRFEGVTLGALTVSGLFYDGGGTYVSVTGAAGLQGLSLTGEVRQREIEDKETKEKKWVPDTVKIDDFGIKSITGTGITLDMPAKDMRLDIPKGSLGGIWAKGVEISLPKDGKEMGITGAGGLGSLDLPNLQAKLGKSLTYKGSLSMTDLGVGLATDGTRTITLGNLDAHGVATMAAGSSIKVDLTGLKGKVVQKGDEIVLSGVEVGDLTLGKSHYEASGTALDIGKRASFKGIKLNARLKTKEEKDPESKEGKTKTTLSQFMIDTLDVNSIDAEDVHATMAEVPANEKKGTEKQDEKRIDLAKANISGLHVIGFDVLNKTGEIKVDSGDLTGLHAAIGKKGKETLEANANVHTKGLRFQLFGPDHMAVDFGTTSIDGDVTTKDPKTKADTTVKFDAKNLTGKVEQTKDGYVLSNVGLESIAVPYAKYSAPGQLVQLRKGAALEKIVLEKAEILMEDKPAATPGGKPSRVVKTVIVKELGIKKITAESLDYLGASEVEEGGKKGTSSMAVLMKSVTVNDLKVHELYQDLLGGTSRLNVETGAVDVKGLDAAITKTIKGKAAETTTFFGNLNAGSMNANITAKKIKRGGAEETEVSGTAGLTGLGLSNFRVGDGGNTLASGDKAGVEKLDLTLKGDKGTTVEAKGVSGANIKIPMGGSTLTLGQIEAQGGTVELDAAYKPKWAIIPELTLGTKAGIPAIGYEDPQGLNAKITKGKVQNIRIDWKDGKMSTAKVGLVVVEDGTFSADLGKMAAMKPPAKEGDKVGDPLDMSFLGGLNGNIDLSFYWWYQNPLAPKGRGASNTEKLRIALTKGKFNAKEFENQFSNMVDWFGIDFEQKGTKIGLDVSGPVVWVDVGEEGKKEFDKHGTIKFETFIELGKKFGAQAAAAPKEEGEPSLYLPMDRVKMSADLTVDGGTAINLPGVGKLTVGTAGGKKSSMTGKTSLTDNSVTLDLMSVALDSIDWTSSTLNVKTGHVTLDEARATYDWKSNVINGSLKKATVNDIDVKL